MEYYDDNEDILNSSLYSISSDEQESIKYKNEVFNNAGLKYGIIVKCYEIDDDANVSKKSPEYKVLAVEQKQEESVEPKFYDNCISIDGFGGVADFFEYKLRPIEKEKKDKSPINIDFREQYGNMVLLLCLDGSTDKAIIIKSLPHISRDTKLTKDAGMHMEGEYNGLNWQVNKDGELTVTFNSSTDNEGNPSDLEALGTNVKLDKTGSISIDTDNETSIKLDKPGQDISVIAGNNITNTAASDITVEAGGKFSAKSTADFLMEAGGSAKFSSKSKIAIEGKGEVTLKGSEVTIESDGSVSIKGSTVEIDAPLINLGKGGLPAVTPLTKFIGISPFLGLPVICNAVGPFSTGVFIK